MKISSLVFVFASAIMAGVASADVMTFEVASGDADRTITAEEASALINSGNDLAKTGGGRLIIDKSLKGYKGEIQIREGYLLARHLEAFGDTDKGTVVSDGATLEFDVPDGTTAKSTLKFGPEKVSFEGIGVNGCGALYYVNKTLPQYCQVFSNLTMTGNARVSGARTSTATHSQSQRWDIRGNGVLDMNGHDLEVAGDFGLCGASVLNPGNINLSAVHGYGTFYLEGSNVKLNGSAENVINVPAHTKLSHQTPKAYDWSVRFDGGVFAEINAYKESTALNTCCINGKLSVTENGATFYGSNKTDGKLMPTHLTIAGDVDIKGPIRCDSGSTTLSLVVVQSADEDESVALRRLSELRSHFVNASNCHLDDNIKIVLQTTAGSREMPLVAGGDFDGVLAAALSGNAAISLTGSQTLTDLRLGPGYFKITGNDKTHELGQLTLNGDTTLDVVDAGKIDAGGLTNVYIGASYPSVAKLRLENSSFVTNYPAKPTAKYKVPAVRVGPRRYLGTADDSSTPSIADWAHGRGIIEVADGGVFTNTLWLGRVESSQTEANSWCHGSLYLRDGGRAMTYSGDQYAFIGSFGSGYIEQTGGSFITKSFFYLGGGKYGRGILYQSGGTSLYEGTIVLGQYSTSAQPSKGVLWLTGGTLTAWSAVISGKTYYDHGNCGDQDQITVSGGTMSVDNGFDLAGTTDAKTTVNLNGGTVYAHFMQVLTNQLQNQGGTVEDIEYTGNAARVNFNGGIFRYRRNKNKANKDGYRAESFFYGDPTRLTLTSYDKGAIFQVDSGMSANLNHPILAPSGMGVKSIALPANFGDIPDGAYIGAPHVEIDGDGVGATAVATFDSTVGRVTGVVVTSPGCDYTTATAKLTRGGYTNSVDLVVTLGSSTSGGLTKTGKGTLKLNADNSYSGKTVVGGGTLIACSDKAIPPSSAIEVNGGTLDAGGYSRDYGEIASSSGTLKNAAGTYTKFVKTGNGTTLFTAPLKGYDAVIDVQEGTLKLPVGTPGFIAGEKVYAEGEPKTEYNNRTALTNLGIELEPTRTHYTVDDDYFEPLHYLTYSGYLWNRDSTNRYVTFAYAFDDAAYLYVDGKYLVATKQRPDLNWGSLWTVTTELTPGAHAVKFLFYNGSGAGGAVQRKNTKGCIKWRDDIVGFAWDPNGNNSTNGNDFVQMADPGDGSLITATADDGSTMPEYGTLRLATGTTLDVSGGILPLSRTLEIALNEKNDAPVQVKGGISFATGATLAVPGLELEGDEKLVLMESSAGFTGVKPTCDANYRVLYRQDASTGKHQLLIARRKGLTIFVM